MILHVRHTTHYDYAPPAWDSFNELWACPADDDRQSLKRFELTVQPVAPVRQRTDYYGNKVAYFHLLQPHEQLTIAATSEVVTFAQPPPPPVSVTQVHELRGRFFEFLAPTPRVPLDVPCVDRLGLQAPAPDADLVTTLDHLAAHLQQALTYAPASTNVATPLAEFLRQRCGVCQDYAHAMLAVCRTFGIPARYASGYLHIGTGCHGSHAWVEAYVPGAGWLGYDPTNGRRVDEEYVKVAHGKDYDDCPPSKGLRRGGGAGALTVTVAVTAATA